jgi:O-antigen ligase
VSGLLWTLGVYAGVVLIGRRFGLISLSSPDERRLLYAVLLVLAGAHSTAVRTGAEDVVSNPVVLETALRGLLDVLALLVVLPVIARMPWQQALRRHIGASSLIVYLAVAGVSVVYSAAPIVTAGKVFELAVGMAVILTALRPEPSNSAGLLQGLVRTVVLFEAGLLLVAVVGFFVMPGAFSQLENRPGFALPQTLTSPFAHSNGLSSMGALVSVYAWAQVLTGATGASRRIWMVLGGAGALGVVLASGRQGVVIWLASMAVLLWVCRRRLFVLLVGPVAVGLVVAYRDVIAAALARGQASVTLATWSGRFDFWEAALSVWRQHPWLGYGFGVGGRFVALESIGRSDISSLHSGYMEALTGVGLFGLIPLGVATGLVIVWAIQSLRAGREIPAAILVIPLLLRTLVSDGFGAWVNAELLVFAALVLMADDQRRPTQTRRRSGTHEPGKLAEYRLP